MLRVKKVVKQTL